MGMKLINTMILTIIWGNKWLSANNGDEIIIVLNIHGYISIVMWDPQARWMVCVNGKIPI